MPRSLFWLSNEAWAAFEPYLPKNQPGARRFDDRRVISGSIHMLKCHGRWAYCPSEYGPSTTVHNRWKRQQRPDEFPFRIGQVPTAHDCICKAVFSEN